MVAWRAWFSVLRHLPSVRLALEQNERDVRALRDELAQFRHEADDGSQTLHRGQQTLLSTTTALSEDIRRSNSALEVLRGQVADAIDEQAGHATRLEQFDESVKRESQSLRARLDRVDPQFPPMPNLGSADNAAWFHAGIEETFRGPRETIVQRLRVYLPFVEPLRAAAVPVRALDLGCGRGEWIELLRGEGIEATGVDENPVIVDMCVKRSLPVVRADAFLHLRAQPDGAYDLVTSFHVIEHLPTETAVAWLLEIRRVLRPGGVLILETQNAKNLTVGASTFYYDPTHRHPIPAELLRYFVEFARFDVVEILPLQPDELVLEVAREEGWPPTLQKLLAGARDLGFVARVPPRDA